MIEPLLGLLLGILVVLAIIAANGYFVAQEFAYMSVDRTRLAARAAQGDVAAKRALAVTKRTSFMLSGAQLGITNNRPAGRLSSPEPLVGQSLVCWLGSVAPEWRPEVGIAVGTLLGSGRGDHRPR